MTKHDGVLELLQQVRDTIHSARKATVRGINTLQVMTNFEIGRLIFEYKQKGKKRAKYGTNTIKDISNELSAEFGRGFSQRNLEYMRRFYLEWHVELDNGNEGPLSTMPDEMGMSSIAGGETQIAQTLSAELGSRLVLSWSHYIFLMEIKNPDERRFYCTNAENAQSFRAEMNRHEQ